MGGRSWISVEEPRRRARPPALEKKKGGRGPPLSLLLVAPSGPRGPDRAPAPGGLSRLERLAHRPREPVDARRDGLVPPERSPRRVERRREPLVPLLLGPAEL